jgi:PAS domain S-box-containing protein
MFPGKANPINFNLLIPRIQRGIRSRIDAGFTQGQAMTDMGSGSIILDGGDGSDGIAEIGRKEDLLKAGALQNAILTSANFSIIATDEKGIIQLFNVGAERMLGYRAAEVVNKIRPSDMHDPQEVMARAQALSAELGTTITSGFEALAFKASRGIEDTYELTYIRKDGSRFPAIVSITALRDDYGDLIGYLLIGADNSVRKQVELELHDAMAVAERANLAKSNFLSSMSHELRTPLSAILGFAQLIESGTPSPTVSQKRSVDQILKAGWFLLELINEVLDLALIESGKLSLSLEPIALAEVMNECRAMIGPQAQKRGIDVAFPQFAHPYYVRADRTRLKQVFINLLSNAIKYNRTGGAVIVEYSAGTPGRMRICVNDTGAGLNPEKLAQLFQPFNRLGQEANGEEGTGIGLVVCKRLVELMGGVIGAESAVGKGSVFWFELNLTAAPGPGTFAAAPEAAVAPQGRTDAQVHTLLYVEDNPANMMLVEDLIARRPDIRLLSAINGNHGVEIARASLPDVILMDINLPGISGIKALAILREDPATARIPVVALSANAMPRDIQKGLDAGFFRYLTKPIKVNEFMDTLDLALKFAKSEAACLKPETQT